jgi:polyisoprenoid-binding protein YceI
MQRNGARRKSRSKEKRRAGFEATTTINRQDFNIRWNRAVEGGNLIGDDVKLEIAIAAVQQ